MFIIWGWGHTKIKKEGNAGEIECNNCGHKRPWELINYSVWITVFFIPIIPYTRKKFLSCPVCSNTAELENEDYKALKQKIAEYGDSE